MLMGTIPEGPVRHIGGSGMNPKVLFPFGLVCNIHRKFRYLSEVPLLSASTCVGSSNILRRLTL